MKIMLGARSIVKNKGHIRQGIFECLSGLYKMLKIELCFKIYFNPGIIFFFLRKLFFLFIWGEHTLEYFWTEKGRHKSQFKRLFHRDIPHFDFGSTKIKYSVDNEICIYSWIFLREIKASLGQEARDQKKKNRNVFLVKYQWSKRIFVKKTDKNKSQITGVIFPVIRPLLNEVDEVNLQVKSHIGRRENKCKFTCSIPFAL